MTWYLKYRPQRIAELDEEDVRKTLKEVLKTTDLPHAFLLVGPRGLGKTSTARIMAKVVNCLHPEQGEPCNECEMCVAITAGSCPDVIEIDAASNRGIDDVRDLRDKARLAPMMAKKKVYIIDEAHMLTLEAANALLKMLEEPPPRTVFFLCTTEENKLPETVISRCTPVRFRKATVGEILNKLKVVAKAEQMEITEPDLAKVVKAARGSFRDAIKLLEQVKLAGGQVEVITGGASGAEGVQLFGLMGEGKQAEAIELVEKLAEGGVDLKNFCEEAVVGVKELVMEKLAKGSKDFMSELSFIEGIQGAYEQMKGAVVVQLPLELWILKWGKKEGVKPQEEKGSLAEVKPIPVKVVEVETRPVVEEKVIPNKVEKPAEESKESKNNIAETGADRLADILGKWTEILRVVRPKNHSVEALLRSTKPTKFNGLNLDLEVAYKFHKDKLESEKCRSIVEAAVGEVLGGGPVRVNLALVERKKPPGEEITGKVGEDIVAAAEEIFKVEAI